MALRIQGNEVNGYSVIDEQGLEISVRYSSINEAEKVADKMDLAASLCE